jgi:hypothetical protein
VPPELTATVVVKADVLVGVLLIAAGALQVLPPSVDLEITTWLTAPPVNRASSQTTYSSPVLASMATEGRPAPVRRRAPLVAMSKSKPSANCWAETVVGCDQVVPPSDDLMKPTLTPRGMNLGEPVV